MRYSFGFLMAVAVLAFAACGDNDGNCVESVDVAGEWEMTTTDVIDSCGGRVPYTFPMTITPNGNALTAELPGGTLTGTICGDQVRLSGSFPEDDGTVTVSVALIVSADGDSMQGSDSWSWTDGSTDCSGSDSLSGTRTQEFPCTEQGIRDAVAEGGGPHTFSCNGPQIVTTEAEIEINNDVILHGKGELTVNGDGDHRVFSVPEGVEAELRGIVVTNGTVSNDVGGGILNQGTLTLIDCTVSENTADVGADGYGDGGGVFNEGTLALTDCTVSGNSAGDDGGGIVNTGPIADPNSGVLTLTNSTVWGNIARFGGGIWNGKTTTVTNSTVSENTAADFGGGIDSGRTPTVLTVTNSTFSGNNAGVEGNAIFGGTGHTLTGSLIDGDCSGPVTSNGYNIESPDDTCGFDTNKGDQVNVSTDDLNLGPLQDNFGPTMTHALLTEPTVSAAIDQIPAADCEVTTDQRGMPRPGERMCDVGSVELQSHELP